MALVGDDEQVLALALLGGERIEDRVGGVHGVVGFQWVSFSG